MAFVSIDHGDQVVLATEQGDDGTLTDKTGCLTDDSSGTSCVEVKAAQGIRIEINFDPGSIDKAVTTSIRIGVNSIMASGPLRIAPYTDANSISNTNGVDTVSIGAGGNVDTDISDAFIDDLGDLGGKFAIRIFENGLGSPSKIKVGEMDYDLSEVTFSVSPLPILKDDGGTIIVGGEYIIHKVASEDPMVLGEIRQTGVTDASGEIASLELPAGDWVILWRDHNVTEANSAVDMSHIFTITAP